MSLSCNPAALSLEEVSHFRANFVFDDNLANVIRTSNKLSKDDTLGFINEISSHEKALSSQGHLNFWYQDEWWAVGATPQRGVLITKASNPAYLEVESTAAIETELFFKAGALLENHRRFSLGIDLRYVFRDFVDKKVDLIEATSDLDLMAIQTGQQLYIEPGLIYSFDSAWKTEISAAITNLGFLIKGEKIRERAIVDLGLSSTPDFLDQKFRSTIHFSTALLSSSMDDVVQCFRWSGLIAVSNNLSATYTLASNEQALGAIGRVDSLILGIGLKTKNPCSTPIKRIISALCTLI